MKKESGASKKNLFSEFVEVPGIEGYMPYYKTNLGAAFAGNCLQLTKGIASDSINLIVTSPPYALETPKEYGNVDKASYVDWFLPFVEEFKRILAPDGSFVLNIAGSYNKGKPTKSLYHYKLLIALVEQAGLHLCQEFYWYNPAKIPVPTEWVTVRRIRVKDAVEHVWWFSKTPWPKADNRNVQKTYSKYVGKFPGRRIVRPSGHVIKESFTMKESGGAITANVFEEQVDSDFLKFGASAGNDRYALGCKARGIKMHPARFPARLPAFFILFLTDEHDIVLDPFAGSNTTGAVAERLNRRWMAMEEREEYLEGSKERFG